MSQCQVRMVSATMSSSVRMSAVKEMATTCTNSASNSTRALTKENTGNMVYMVAYLHRATPPC
ncbi:hypothetical protein EYF80_020812 [Liparis tanakae]|uniref:Uncharacterized protein n=1 Tax=Liparis tanakae TaxID=230148 RepID=A0A4Z2HTS4_9TELE|nr:hypothetical protein EYF80_020812 [Liparis tanakae]